MPDDSDITNVSFGAPRELLSPKSYIIGAISLQKKGKLLLPFITDRSEMLVFWSEAVLAENFRRENLGRSETGRALLASEVAVRLEWAQ